MESDSEIENRIRHRAYQIWEQEGRPEGEALAHWEWAKSEIALLDGSLIDLLDGAPGETSQAAQEQEPVMTPEDPMTRPQQPSGALAKQVVPTRRTRKAKIQ